MDKQTELAIVRHAYAKQVMAAAGIVDPRVQAAYAEVRREDFLGPGPWQMLRFPGGYCVTPDADPVLLYVDQLFGLVPERKVNNGQPSVGCRSRQGRLESGYPPDPRRDCAGRALLVARPWRVPGL